MDKLMFYLHAVPISEGEIARLAINAKNYSAETLHHLSLRIGTSTNLQLLGPNRLTIEQIQPGENLTIDLVCKGLVAGRAELQLDRVNALSGGQTIDFPVTSFQLDVIKLQQYTEIAPRLSIQPVSLTQNNWAEIRLQLENNSAFHLESIQLVFSGRNLFFGNSGSRLQEISIERVNPYQSYLLSVSILPRSPGDERLEISLKAFPGGQAIQRRYEFVLPVAQDTRPQETHISTGDILNLRGQMSFAGDVNSEANMRLGETKKPAQILCPSCREWIERDSNFCVYCQRKIEVSS